jgi:hypothetical protein
MHCPRRPIHRSHRQSLLHQQGNHPSKLLHGLQILSVQFFDSLNRNKMLTHGGGGKSLEQANDTLQ